MSGCGGGIAALYLKKPQTDDSITLYILSYPVYSIRLGPPEILTLGDSLVGQSDPACEYWGLSKGVVGGVFLKLLLFSAGRPLTVIVMKDRLILAMLFVKSHSHIFI
ncbi:hypothetical protein XENTR_v10012529 [Xenopus tropicalis]|nr:hypothetical protein XENTR_v10012529 [Xenopus tropicalis]